MKLSEQERERIADIAFKHGNIQAAWNGKYPIFFEWDEEDIAIMLSLIDRLAQEPSCEGCEFDGRAIGRCKVCSRGKRDFYRPIEKEAADEH